ncbi:MAG: [Fe-Fe] hydrogenase large subunit C-terminal domain-containing protein [bacterium]
MSLLTISHPHCKDKDYYKCLRSCPIKAIKVCKGAMEIVDERCISEGLCVNLCPQGAIQAIGESNKVKNYIDSGNRVIASVSPTTVLTFGGDAPKFENALKQLGFTEVEYMGDAVASMIKEYRDLLSQGSKPVISSHCPAICNLVEKYVPEAIEYLAPIIDPATGHARIIKSQMGEDVRVVYIGPCLAQRTREGTDLDAVLTFNEIENWFKEVDIRLPRPSAQDIGRSAYSFAGLPSVSGGLLAALGLKESAYGGSSICISGVEDALKFLHNLPPREMGLEFVDLMACYGGCIGGPFLRTKFDMVNRRFILTRTKPPVTQSSVPKMDLGWKPHARPFIPPKTSEEEINYVQRHHTSHLDCGICGYDSCFQKAKAVCEGMADVEICVPMIRTQGQETLSILEYTPNGVLLVDTETRIRFANPSFYRMFKCEGKDVLGHPTANFILSNCFETAVKSPQSSIFKRTIPELGISFRACIFPIKGESLYCGIFNDISEEEDARQEFSKVKNETLNRTQEVIGRQMKTAQEIAGLLGETTAETKVLLVKLMNLFKEEEAPLKEDLADQ